MNSVVDMIINGANSVDISDKIKEILYTKSSENIEAIRPYVANSLFDDNSEEYEEEE